MIIDFQADPRHAVWFHVLDAATGECLNDLCIWYADDVAGVFRYYEKDGKSFVLDPATRQPRWIEVRRPIRIEPRDDAPAYIFTPAAPPAP
jgi:GAF domain-containing protein